MDLLKLRKKYGYSQDYVAKYLGVTRLTYASREEGKTELKHREQQKLYSLFSKNESEEADVLIKDNAELSVYQLEYILEGLQDQGLLSDKGIMVRSNIRERFIKDRKIFKDKYISTK